MANISIDELVNNLVDGKNVTSDDKLELKQVIKDASKSFDNDKLSLFFKELELLMTATGNSLINDGKINVDSIRNIVGDAIKAVEKESIEQPTINSQSYQNTSNIEEIFDISNDIPEQEREEFNKILADKKNSINTVLSTAFGEDFEDLPDDFKADLITYSAKSVLANREFKRLINNNIPPDKAKTQACKKYNMSTDEFELGIVSNLVDDIINLATDENIQDATQQYCDTHKDALEILTPEQRQNIHKYGIVEVFQSMCQFILIDRQIDLEQSSHQLDKDIKASKVTFSDLKTSINKKLKTDKKLACYQKWIQKLGGLDRKKDISPILEDAAKQYFTTGESLSDIYDELKKNKDLKGVPFEDLLKEVLKTAEGNMSSISIDIIKNNEIALRDMSLKLNSYNYVYKIASESQQQKIHDTGTSLIGNFFQNDKELQSIKETIDQLQKDKMKYQEEILVKKELYCKNNDIKLDSSRRYTPYQEEKTTHESEQTISTTELAQNYNQEVSSPVPAPDCETLIAQHDLNTDDLKAQNDLLMQALRDTEKQPVTVRGSSEVVNEQDKSKDQEPEK